MVLLQLKDPLELFVKRREFLPCSGFLSRSDINLSVEIGINNPLLPSFIYYIGYFLNCLHYIFRGGVGDATSGKGYNITWCHTEKSSGSSY